MTDNPQAPVYGSVDDVLARRPMTARQILAIGICVVLNAIDGFDVLSISFASPGIAAEWKIDRATLGVVLSLELFGMGIGAVLLGSMADRVGRRPMILGCLLAMSLGMAATAFVESLPMLAVARVFTGLGIGGMLATTNALVAEYSNTRWRGTAVAIMAAGFPLGGIVGGLVVAELLEVTTWRSIFLFGAAITLLSLSLAVFLLPESIGLLRRGDDEGALRRINVALRRLGHVELDVLPPSAPKAGGGSFRQIFGPGIVRTTALLTAAFFLHIFAVYFLLKWSPKIIVDMGYTASVGSQALVWVNIGGMTGGLVFSILSMFLPLRSLIIVFLLLSASCLNFFGAQSVDLLPLFSAAAAAGFWANGAVVGLYAFVAGSFPTSMRGAGTGFVIGVGRGGAALGPVVAGIMFQAGIGLQVVTAIISLASILAAAALWLVPTAAARR